MNIIVNTNDKVVIALGETIEDYNNEVWKIICNDIVGYCRKSPHYEIVYDVVYPDQPNEYGQYFTNKYLYDNGVFLPNPDFVEN